MKRCYLITMLLLCASLTVWSTEFAQLESRVKEVLSTVESPEQALDSALILTFNDKSWSPETKERITCDYIIPYADKHEKDVPLWTFAKIYRSLSLNYSYMGEVVKRGEAIKKAYDYARRMEEKDDSDRLFKAYVFYSYASYEMEVGDMVRAHDLFFEAIPIYEQMGYYHPASNCLYQLAVTYCQLKDVVNLKKVIDNMARIAEKADEESRPGCLYYLYTVKAVNFSFSFENDKKNRSLLDSMLLYSHKSIQLMEAYPDKMPSVVNPAWNYYNYAVNLHNLVPGASEDSIRYYTGKALNVKGMPPVIRQEVEISVGILLGELEVDKKNYRQAIKELEAVYQKADSLKERNTLLVERIDCCDLLVKSYSGIGRYDKALEYQKQLTELSKTRYDEERTAQLDELSVKYEVEKKNMEIENLESKERFSKRIMQLLVVALLIALLAISAIVVVFRLRRKNMEHRLYESALESEMNRSQLDSIREEYDSLRNKLENRQQSLHFKKLFEKMEVIVRDSALDADTKERYAEVIHSVNLQEFEEQFSHTIDKMTQMDLKYIVCFYLNFESKDIAVMFNVEAASVYTVRYRLRKKFKDNPAFRFLMR